MRHSSINKIRDFPLVKFNELHNKTVTNLIFTLTFIKLRKNKNIQWAVLNTLGHHLAIAHRYPSPSHVMGQKAPFLSCHVWSTWKPLPYWTNLCICFQCTLLLKNEISISTNPQVFAEHYDLEVLLHLQAGEYCKIFWFTTRLVSSIYKIDNAEYFLIFTTAKANLNFGWDL